MGINNLGLYHNWVGEKSRKILNELTEEEFDQDCGEILGSVRQKVEHMVFALITCFSHLNENLPFMEESLPETYRKVAGYTRDMLMDCWEDLDKRIKSGITDDLRGTVELKRGDGGSFCLKLDDLYLQYIIHSIYHRGQLNYNLKFLNKPRINADYLFYFDKLDASLEENQEICSLEK
jgi:uncharacterized damage-inducible protein DinB